MRKRVLFRVEIVKRKVLAQNKACMPTTTEFKFLMRITELGLCERKKHNKRLRDTAMLGGQKRSVMSMQGKSNFHWSSYRLN